MAIVKAIMMQPELMKQLPDLDAETLFTVLQKEFPDLPEAICQRIVPRMLEIDPQKLPWNRRLRRKMMKSKRLIVHLFAGPDEKNGIIGRLWRMLTWSVWTRCCIHKAMCSMTG